MTKPIQVSDSTLPSTLAAALRYAIGLVGAYLVGKGYIDAENIEGIATLVITAATVAYGLYRTQQTKAKLIVTAEAAPNSVAVVK